MEYSFNQNALKNTLQKSDWYLQLENVIREFFIRTNQFPSRAEIPSSWLDYRTQFLTLISEALKNGEISVAQDGPNMDGNRSRIDTVVIHHTSNTPDFGFDQINAISLLRLYAKHYLDRESRVYSDPIWSNHVVNGRQVFVPYHYLVSPSGDVIKSLPEKYVGWHCGDRIWNARSVAICFLGDFEDSEPSEAAIKAAKEIIKRVHPEHILGHMEISAHTTCPGKRFLSEQAWKFKLIS